MAFKNDTGLDSRYGEYLQARCLDILRKAYGDRCFVGTPAQPRRFETPRRDTHYAAPIVYLHSKVSVFDNHTAVVSSANLNGRSFRWDTETGVRFDHPSDVARVLSRGGRALDPRGRGGELSRPAHAVKRWRIHAEANAVKLPERRTSFLLPYREEPARRFGRNLPGVPEDMV